MSNMAMVSALMDRAGRLRSEIGDHGDAYEASLLLGQATPELSIRTTEIARHVKEALDYSFGDLVGNPVGGDQARSKAFFPIAHPEEGQRTFRERLVNSLPQQCSHSNALVELIESLQVFAHPRNAWLSNLATALRSGMHIHLEITRGTVMAISSRIESSGSMPQSSELVFLSQSDAGEDSFKPTSISLPGIHRDVLTFLDQCISGAQRVVAQLAQIPRT